MNSKNYIQDAIRTESTDFQSMDQRLGENGTKRLLHAGIGLATEAGEFLDALKKHIFYGKELDRVNLKEEMGDIFWYMAIACDELGVEFEPLMERNIAKLKARYGEKFTENKAENRDLESERVILEQ
ncbi:MAG: nucleoside triphosphate pyrophosphohydrolase family protein [Bacteriovoracaceae bacterium]|nr:nucleoside triphosphate pyrophosphohydrolase family protein [Bacteriovoracaceae bacterium]